MLPTYMFLLTYALSMYIIYMIIFRFGIKGVVFILTKIVCLPFRNFIEYGIKEYFNYIQEKERGERERNYICFCNHAFIYPEDIRCPVMMRTMIMSITIGARAFPQKLGIHAFQIWVYSTALKVNVYMNIIQQHFP